MATHSVSTSTVPTLPNNTTDGDLDDDFGIPLWIHITGGLIVTVIIFVVIYASFWISNHLPQRTGIVIYCCTVLVSSAALGVCVYEVTITDVKEDLWDVLLYCCVVFGCVLFLMVFPVVVMGIYLVLCTIADFFDSDSDQLGQLEETNSDPSDREYNWINMTTLGQIYPPPKTDEAPTYEEAVTTELPPSYENAVNRS